MFVIKPTIAFKRNKNIQDLIGGYLIRDGKVAKKKLEKRQGKSKTTRSVYVAVQQDQLYVATKQDQFYVATQQDQFYAAIQQDQLYVGIQQDQLYVAI